MKPTTKATVDEYWAGGGKSVVYTSVASPGFEIDRFLFRVIQMPGGSEMSCSTERSLIHWQKPAR